MKKIAPFIILFVLAIVAWNVFVHSHGMVFNIDGDEIDGPFGALIGLLFAGGGTLIAGLVMLVVGVVLAVVFAGVGIILLGALGVAALAVAAAISPLLLPLLLPLAIIWFFVNRSRRNRALREHAV
ncbi:hypothetical protein [Massilia horti]|uniref:Transmembrane protein n=1 Tax=Massilia horti TaxID=2562153 RepID=A0A4Y9SV63_9BURK|nr:hypothetical protein [Massilia horti]TFW29229.1 hypothetical protein E4O92_19300 [Massilia horti]